MAYSFNINDFDLRKIKEFSKVKIIESDNFVTVNKACTEAQEFSVMTAIIGEPGFGKTSALRYFAKTHENVFYITVKKSMTAKIFYTKLLETIGYDNIHKSNNIYHIIDSIAYYLSQSKTRYLIIIDEAGKLTHQKLLYLHDLRDAIATNAGIILAGPKYFEKNITEMVKKGVEGLPELNRRILTWIELTTPSSQEKRALMMEYGIRNQGLLNSLSMSSRHNTLSDIYNLVTVFGMKVNRFLEDYEDPN